MLYLPDLEKNLLSVTATVKLGATVQFEGEKCEITRNSKVLAVGKMQEKLYVLKIVADEHVHIAKEDSNLELWHYRFGHLGMHNVNKLMNDDMVKGMDSVNDGGKDSVCEGCVMGKQHRTEYPKGVAKRATEPFELVHSDVCGPMSVHSIGGSRFFVTFIDDYSRYTHVYFIQRKDHVLEKFKEFVTLTTYTLTLVSKLKLYVLTVVVSIVPKNSTPILRRRHCPSDNCSPQSCSKRCIGKDESHTSRISQINDVSCEHDD